MHTHGTRTTRAAALIVAVGCCLAIAACGGTGSGAAGDESVTLRLATSTIESSVENEGLFQFVAQVEEEAPWIEFEYLGGPETVEPTDTAESVQIGAFDIASVCTCYSSQIIPEATALEVAPTSPAEDRENGALEIVQRFYEDKGLYYLGGPYHEIGFVLHFGEGNRGLDAGDLDLSGLLMRAPESVQPALEAFGAEVVNLPISEVYTAMDRGTIDGFAAGNAGLEQLGIAEPVDATLDVTLMYGRHPVILNLDTWNGLSTKTQDALTSAMAEVEQGLSETYNAFIEEQNQLWDEEGKVFLEVDDAAREQIAERARDAVWDAVVSRAPDAEELRTLYGGLS